MNKTKMADQSGDLKSDAPHIVIKNVQIYDQVTNENFLRDIYPLREPAVLRGVDLGSASELWKSENYLATRGGSVPIRVHVCDPSGRMDFINKNFAYKTLPFDEFVKRANLKTKKDFFFDPDETYYLRALGNDPRKDIADIKVQFPALASDIKLPEFYPQKQFFSSVFRISSAGTQLWTHYDVMDNLLVQVTGHKKVVLFSPKDTGNLYMSGDKSQVLDVENPDLIRYPKFCKATQYKCELQPGDILFIPAMWFHNVTATEFGVAVNVFWRHLEEQFYDMKDTYGNKDLVPAFRAMQITERAMKALEELPDEYKDFYARRIVAHIKTRLYSFK